jgi:aryl-alcohol dehydrogenase-like predicted oxidoreductase
MEWLPIIGANSVEQLQGSLAAVGCSFQRHN